MMIGLIAAAVFPFAISQGPATGARLTVPSTKMRCFVLDGAGRRTAAVPAGGRTVALDQAHGTLWYEIEMAEDR